MKKLFVLFGVLACLTFGLSHLALAADGATMYKRSCAGCHGQSAERGAGGTAPIVGKSSGEIQKMLLGYKDGSFGGKQKNSMVNVVKRLADDDIKAISDFVGSLKK